MAKKKLTSTQIAEQLKEKLNVRYGVTPEDATDEQFYRACSMILREISDDHFDKFTKEVRENGQVVYTLNLGVTYIYEFTEL